MSEQQSVNRGFFTWKLLAKMIFSPFSFLFHAGTELKPILSCSIVKHCVLSNNLHGFMGNWMQDQVGIGQKHFDKYFSSQSFGKFLQHSSINPSKAMFVYFSTIQTKFPYSLFLVPLQSIWLPGPCITTLTFWWFTNFAQWLNCSNNFWHAI